MVAVDFIGVIFTILLIGPHYAHYVIAAMMTGEIGRILMTLFVNGQVDMVVTGGIFGGITFHDVSGIAVLLVYFSGVFFNYFIGMACGGVERETLFQMVNPFAAVRHPFAVVNLRLAVLAGLYNGWQYLSR